MQNLQPYVKLASLQNLHAYSASLPILHTYCKLDIHIDGCKIYMFASLQNLNIAGCIFHLVCEDVTHGQPYVLGLCGVVEELLALPLGGV